jgi:hypothetical protein
VSVPVLSEHRTSIPASSSIAESRVTTAWACAIFRAPTAIVTESTVGRATGIAAMVRTSTNCTLVTGSSPRTRETASIRIASAIATTMSALPILRTARWKWLTVWAVSTSSAVRPKKVRGPVAETTASASPRVTVEVE